MAPDPNFLCACGTYPWPEVRTRATTAQAWCAARSPGSVSGSGWCGWVEVPGLRARTALWRVASTGAPVASRGQVCGGTGRPCAPHVGSGLTPKASLPAEVPRSLILIQLEERLSLSLSVERDTENPGLACRDEEEEQRGSGEGEALAQEEVQGAAPGRRPCVEEGLLT